MFSLIYTYIMKLTYLSELDDDDDPPELSSLLWSESDDSSSDTFCNLNPLLYTDGNMVPGLPSDQTNRLFIIVHIMNS